MSTATETLFTAEQYRLLPDDGQRTELLRGKVVEMNVPAPRHGYFCALLVRILGNFAAEHDVGRVMSNDAGVLTERNPDTVRGADVCYYSYKKLPKGPIPEGYLAIVPELVFEVRSPTDRWSKVIVKVGEYLNAGVQTVCVLDTQTETLTVYHADELQRVLTADDDWTLPDLFGPDFRVPVRRLLSDRLAPGCQPAQQMEFPVMATALETLLTAEQYHLLPDDGRRDGVACAGGFLK